MILSFKQLPQLRKKHKDAVVVFVGGCFDIVHVGHVEMLEFAKTQGDILVVGVPSDMSVRERKGSTRPVRSQAKRVRVIDAFKPVDYSLVLPE